MTGFELRTSGMGKNTLPTEPKPLTMLKFVCYMKRWNGLRLGLKFKLFMYGPKLPGSKIWGQNSKVWTKNEPELHK